MAQGDELDVVIRDPRVSGEEWAALARALGLERDVPAATGVRRKAIGRELRQAYGQLLLRPFRDEWSPDYSDIVRGVAAKLKLPVKDHHTVAEIEQRILIELIDRAKAQVIKEKGPGAWEQIEREAEEEIRRAIEEGRVPAAEVGRLRGLGGGVLMAALLGGRLAGFALYVVANQLFFAIARTFGLRIGVAVAGPVIGKSLAFLLGPVGFVLAGVCIAVDLGGTNWKRVVPTVATVALIRARLDSEDKYGTSLDPELRDDATA